MALSQRYDMRTAFELLPCPNDVSLAPVDVLDMPASDLLALRCRAHSPAPLVRSDDPYTFECVRATVKLGEAQPDTDMLCQVPENSTQAIDEGNLCVTNSGSINVHLPTEPVLPHTSCTSVFKGKIFQIYCIASSKLKYPTRETLLYSDCVRLRECVAVHI